MCVAVSSCFFFFKQKTAYEMRISDWSSDVCSSDLLEALHNVADVETHLILSPSAGQTIVDETDWKLADVKAMAHVVHNPKDIGASLSSGSFRTDGMIVRSEEHTSELQSLMRNSYAVFCLKKKQHNHSMTQLA